ncbi:unnamed protein product [Paramecium primaurelia]|uniref:Vesicle transport protein n=1 Tax=Paramecium primaurelia TaxID=5886 RepID=A0A8S1QK80_PARPR|nr:unnamed protein product [Paramecium primaurelia]
MMQIFDIGGPMKPKNENESLFPSLTYKERLMGFAFCSILGYFIQILSFGSFIGILGGSPNKFALTYSLGNILALFGTAFLIGFKKQFENMIDNERKMTSIIFASSLVMIFLSVYLFKSKFLVLIFLLTEFCSYTWYVASYIPFARDCIKGCLRNIIKS